MNELFDLPHKQKDLPQETAMRNNLWKETKKINSARINVNKQQRK